MTPRRGRRLVVPGLLAVALLAAAALLAMQLLLVGAGNQAWEEDDHAAAERQYTRAMDVSVLNAWVPVHNRGVARYELRRWDAAAKDFEQAAGSAPRDRQCAVRLNWSLALESGADALRETDDMSAALVRYTEAEVVLTEADCADEPAGAGGTQSEAWDEARQRVESKKTDGAATWTPPEPPSDGRDRTDEIQERSREAQEERQREQESEGQEPREDGSQERNW